MNDYDFNLDC